ncbi:MAG: ATP-binding protein [Deltaproteobacteria bacterium]|nr:ATP-binding protein [Deltaproteobacteria bacterium]
MITGKHNGTLAPANGEVRDTASTSARVVDRCDRIAFERARALQRALKEDEGRKSLAEELVEELEEELATVSGRAAPASTRAPPTRTEALGAAWWRGHDVVAARLDNARLDDAERDALGLLIGLECGARVATQGIHDKDTEDEDLQTPLRLIRLVELGRFGPLSREQLSPTSRLSTAGLITSAWRCSRRSDPYLAVRPNPRFLAELGDISDTFAWPKPWVRVEAPRETMDDLIVAASLRAEIDEVVELSRHALGGRRALNLEYGRGFCVLLHGPAGTGKTLAARVVAKTLGVPLASYDRARASELGLNDDHAAKLLEAWRPKDGVLFIDEVDDLLDDLRRGQSNALLLGLEAFEGVLLLATNRTLEVRDSLDRRIQRIVSFPYPDAECRQRLIRAHLPRAADIDDDTLRGLARHVLSGGLIKNAVLEATALCEVRDAPLDTNVLDSALQRQNRAARRLVEHDALLARLRQENVDGFDTAVNILRHALDADGAITRARLGLAEPVIDIVAPEGIAAGLVDAIGAALELTLAHVAERKGGERSARDNDTHTDVSHGALALVTYEGEEDFGAPRAMAARARKAHAFAAFRVLHMPDPRGEDPADATVRVDTAAARDIGKALLEARFAAARVVIDDSALPALEALCVTPRDANIALALRIVGAAVAAGHRTITKELVERSALRLAGGRPRGLFE